MCAKINARERQRVGAINATIPPTKRLITEKFVLRIRRIFQSIREYQHSAIIQGNLTPGILRTDINRYDDAIVDATGVVPDQVIGYVEETYQKLKTGSGPITKENLDAQSTSYAMEEAMEQLGKVQKK